MLLLCRVVFVWVSVCVVLVSVGVSCVSCVSCVCWCLLSVGLGVCVNELFAFHHAGLFVR